MGWIELANFGAVRQVHGEFESAGGRDGDDDGGGDGEGWGGQMRRCFVGTGTGGRRPCREGEGIKGSFPRTWLLDNSSPILAELATP